MSRGFVLGVLSTVFVVGGVAGYLVRGSGTAASSSDTPALSRAVEPPPPAVLPPASPPRAVSKTTGALKSVPTPGSFYRLGPKETLSDVTRRAYGGTKRLPELLAVNVGLDPKHVAPGTLVYVPLGIEPIPMLPAEAARPETPKPSPTPPAKASSGRSAPEPSPLFAKPR